MCAAKDAASLSVNHWTVFQSSGISLGTLYRGRVPKPGEVHSGIQTWNFLNQRTMHYPILLLSANFTIIFWKLSRQVEIFLHIYNNTWWSHSIMETGENLKYSSCTNHLRFSLYCHHNKVAPKDIQLKCKIKTSWSKIILQYNGILLLQ